MSGTRSDATGPTQPGEKSPAESPHGSLGEVTIPIGVVDDFEDLIDTGIKIHGDPKRALELLRARVDQRLAGLRVTGPEVREVTDEMPALGTSIPDRSGGAMQSNPSQTTGNRRPFVGFDQERAAYARDKDALLDAAEGSFVVFVGDRMLGPFESHTEAELAGYREFGLGPLFIKQIRPEEEAVQVSRLTAP